MKSFVVLFSAFCLLFLNSCQTLGRTLHSVGRSTGLASVENAEALEKGELTTKYY